MVQDAFIKAHKHLDRFEGTSSFYTWLYRIVMNLAIDQLRKRQAGRSSSTTRIERDEALLPQLLGGNPGRALMDKEIRARIDAALAELSDNHRAVLVMRELEGLSYEEMAKVMGCSKGTIMSRLFHARRNMQKQLADLYELARRRRCCRGAGSMKRDVDFMEHADGEAETGSTPTGAPRSPRCASSASWCAAGSSAPPTKFPRRGSPQLWGEIDKKIEAPPAARRGWPGWFERYRGYVITAAVSAGAVAALALIAARLERAG